MKTLRIYAIIGCMAFSVMCCSVQVEAGSKGDIDPFPGVDLRDAILCLQIMANLNQTVTAAISDADVNGDGKIGLEEEIYILQVVAGLRTDGDGAPAPFTGIVARHNYWRSQVNVQGLTWSSQIAEAAQSWANQLAGDCNLLVHSGSQYGENIAKGFGKTPDQIVDMWASEKANYVYQAFTSAQMNVAHYTQIVWKNTIQVGCGKVTCSNGYEIWVCDYSPAGNFTGQFPY